jgi:hypothetical protein
MAGSGRGYRLIAQKAEGEIPDKTYLSYITNVLQDNDSSGNCAFRVCFAGVIRVGFGLTVTNKFEVPEKGT